MINRPNLFIVGTHKAGTTAVRFLLKQHPQVFFPDGNREMHHFESDLHVKKLIEKKIITKSFLGKTNIDREKYLTKYNAPSSYKIYGDKTPSYLISKTSASEIFEFNPEAKIVALFRDPVDYMYSLHSQNLYNMYEHIEKFELALNAEKHRLRGKKLSAKGRMYRHMLLYKERTNYVSELERFVRLFPNKKIKCLIFEDFKKSNKIILKELEAFLGISEFNNYKFKNVNTNKKTKLRTIRKMVKIVSDLGFIKKILPRKSYDLFQGHYKNMITDFTPRDQLDNTLKIKLKKELKPMVSMFETYLKEENLIDKNYNLFNTWNGYD